MADPRYNVLVLMSDQHSKRQLGCYGDGLVRTPNLDRLAAEGMRFTDAYTPSPLCVPGRTSFMTGRRPTSNRVWRNSHVLSSGIPTWAHSLGAAGYETALVGRMHFVGPDQRHGFEKRPLGEYNANFPGADTLGAPLFQSIPSSTTGQDRISVELAGVGRTSYHAFDDMVSESMCAYLERRARTKDARPFAAVAGFIMPHCPFIAPRDMFDYYFERVSVPQPTFEELARQPEAIKNFKRLRRIDEPLTEHQIRVARAAYHAMCELVDGQVGRILDKLHEVGLDESTLVVYTTDHGEMAGEHGCWWKSNYYEEAVSVPLIVRLPGVVPAGTENDVLCSYMDIGPTLIEMARGGPLPQADGHSLWTELQGQRDESRPDEIFSELLGSIGDSPSRMIRKGPWKLYKYNDGTPPVLYNLDDDPAEMNDLGSDPDFEPVRRRLLERLHDGWDPGFVLKESAALDRDMDLINEWGKKLQPSHEDHLPVPPDAEEVELR